MLEYLNLVYWTLSAQRVTLEVEGFLHELGQAKQFAKVQFYRDLDCYWTRFISLVPCKGWIISVSWRSPPRIQYKLNTNVNVANGRASGGGSAA